MRAQAGTLVAIALAAMKQYSPSGWSHACRIGSSLRRVLLLQSCARSRRFGEDAGRSAEHPVLDRDAPIDAEIVLKLAVIAYGDVGPDHDVLTENAIAPDAASDRRG
jgi:hypothetical protein